jgi:hypothetical protein
MDGGCADPPVLDIVLAGEQVDLLTCRRRGWAISAGSHDSYLHAIYTGSAYRFRRTIACWGRWEAVVLFASASLDLS